VFIKAEGVLSSESETIFALSIVTDLKRLREKPDQNDCTNLEDDSTETSYRSSKRSQSVVLTDTLGEYVAVTKKATEEKVLLKKSELELECTRLGLEQERCRGELELHTRQQESELELRKKRQEADLESQKGRDGKGKAMMDLVFKLVSKKDDS
jgi:hypothetical protein